MATPYVRTDQDVGNATNGTTFKVDMEGITDNIAPMKRDIDPLSPQHTISTCPTFETSDSPTSSAMQPTFSVDSDDASHTNLSANDKVSEPPDVSEYKATEPSDGQSQTVQPAMTTPNRHLATWRNRLTSEQKKWAASTPRSSITIHSELTSERKRWIENTLMNNEYKPHSTPARDEYCKNHNSSDLASERKRWVQQTLLNTEHKSYSTNARDEMCQNQNNSDLTSERKHWIESTLQSNNNGAPKKNNSQDELQQLQKQVGLSLSVAERRQWLSGVTHVKSATELEEEVREEARRLKEEAKIAKEEEARRKIDDVNRAKEEEEQKAITAEEERKQAMTSEDITCKESQCKHSLDEATNLSRKKKRRRLGLKKLVQVFTRKRR